MSGTIRDPTAGAVSPLLNRPNFQGIPDRVPLPNFARDTINGVVKGTAESAINLHTLARELYGVIADAPHSYIHDLNISNPRYTPRTLATAVQGVTGNPGTRGMGVWTQRLSKNVPFYNTTIQALGGSLRAVRDNPIQTGTTIATVLATTALAEHLSALLSGPEHTKFLEDKLSNSTQARNATIFHGPGTDPTNHTELPFPNEWQWLWPAFSGVTGHAIGTWNAHSDEDGLSRLIHTLAGVFDNHVTTDTVKQTGIGAVSAFVPVDTPPLISGAVAGLTGQETRNLPDTLVSNALSGKPLLSGMTSGGGPTHNVPGQEGTDGVLTRANSGTLKAVMSSLGGAFGAAYDMAHNFNQRSKVDPAWAWEGLWRDYKQQWQDNTRYANSIWQNNLPQSTFGPMEERTSGMWRNVAATANVSSDIRGEGFSGVKRGAPLLKAGDSPVPQDPVMRNLYMATAEVGKGISRDLMPRENEIRAQIDNLKSSPFMPEEKRRIGNKLSDQLYDVIAQKHKMLLDLNARLSQLAGGRHVDTGGRINWQGTVDQFHY
jgi:hypothetical protein